MVSRLDPQKGFDLVAASARDLIAEGARICVLGTGDQRLIGELQALASMAEGRGRLAVVARFDRGLARRMYAGADAFLMPSRFEPCGQGQMIALRYGTLPVVRATGGLRDTVIDADAFPDTGTGFVLMALPTGPLHRCLSPRHGRAGRPRATQRHPATAWPSTSRGAAPRATTRRCTDALWSSPRPVSS